MRTETAARAARIGKTAVLPPSCATIHVAEPPHLCRVQTMTRELCRSVGLDESAVFQAVISVTELAHRLFIGRAQCGSIELSVVRRKRGFSLKIRAENDAVPGIAPVIVNLTFPSASASSCS